jgi:tRNA/rRNA methyltransferase
MSQILSNVIIVLEEPRNLVNIAGVVRSMKNMGLSRLRLVRSAEWDPWRIEGIAHRSEDIVEATEHFDRLEDALADCILVVGTSARARTAQRNYLHAREWADRIAGRAREGRIAIVFGREDRGLSNEALDRCDGVAVIPTDPDYSSLNLAQACLLLCYEVRLAVLGRPEELPAGKRSVGPATREEMERMFGALEGGLARIDFFSARTPESVMRIFRTLLSRANMDAHEAGLVQAMGFEIQRVLDREARRDEGRGGQREPTPGGEAE